MLSVPYLRRGAPGRGHGDGRQNSHKHEQDRLKILRTVSGLHAQNDDEYDDGQARRGDGPRGSSEDNSQSCCKPGPALVAAGHRRPRARR